MIEGLFQALSLSTLLWLTLGVMIGMIVGTLLGLTATMGTARLVPVTFALPTGEGIAMLGPQGANPGDSRIENLRLRTIGNRGAP